MENLDFIKNCEKNLTSMFDYVDEVAFFNQKKVLDAFKKHNVQARHFAGSTGYGYDDIGRDTLANVFSSIFNCDDSIVSPHITCATHALSLTLFAILRPNDLLMSLTGTVYDTMYDNILGKTQDIGSLKDFNVSYEEIALKNNLPDYAEIEKQVASKKPKMVIIQKSRGYSSRSAFSCDIIKKIIDIVKNVSSQTCVMVDNCYGEFTEKVEPTDVGADLCVGSFIKNVGGGIAPTGAYICGKKQFMQLVKNRFTCPSLGSEVGSYELGYRMFYQGLFLAPTKTAASIKGAYLVGEIMKQKGYTVFPDSNEKSFDIIKSINLNSEDELVKFVQTIQKNSPVDSAALPMPWDMPGYNDKVIMAAGTFVGGASIELSCDSPIRKPYIAYFQGGLTYEHIKCLCLELLKIY